MSPQRVANEGEGTECYPKRAPPSRKPALRTERTMRTARQLHEEGFGLANLVSGYEIFRTVRVVETPEETDRLRKASGANDLALKALFDAVEPGVTWRELKRGYEYSYMDHGAVPRFWGQGSGPAPYRFNLFQTGSPSWTSKVKEGDVLKLDVRCTYPELLGRHQRHEGLARQTSRLAGPGGHRLE